MTLPRDFAASDLVVLRTPMLPFEEIEAWTAGLRAPSANGDLDEALAHDYALLRRRLAAILERPEVREALFVASPDLFESLGYWHRDPDSRKGQRAEAGLVRYVHRMATRATPFGLFSGCTSGTLGDRTRLAIAPRADYRRHSRLDMDYLFALCEHLGADRSVRADLRFLPNPTLFETAGRLRYAEARVTGRRRTYHLVAVDAFDALRGTLERAKGGATIAELANALVDDEIAFEEAEAFIQQVIDHQLLIPDLALPLTGEESTPGLLRQLAALPSATETMRRVASAEVELGDIDSHGPGAATERYRGIARTLEPLGVPVDMSRLFQIDLVKPARELVVSDAVIGEIARGASLLHRLKGARYQEGVLDEFRKAFRDRYGDSREVPLVEALDEESGIGFGRAQGAGAEASPLLGGLPFRPPGERPSQQWSNEHGVLLRLVMSALAAGQMELELSDGDVKEIVESRDVPPLPDVFHAMASLAAASPEALERGEYTIHMHNAMGPSGARILGRFCHIDDRIRAGVREHLEAEEALAPDALFAEIVHLPAGRVGNILARPLLRDYEIPYLGRSGARADKQISVDDLVVTVNGERIILRSKSHGREVIPRLTTAHNTTGESLGIYRFLGAMQRGLPMEWNWGPLEAATFLPRVTVGRLVLTRARWRFSERELEPLAESDGAARFRLAREWRRRHRMPRWVALVDLDHELLLDFDNPLSIDAVFDLFKKRAEAELVEVFPAPDQLCAVGPEGRFFHELVVLFARRPATAAAAAAEPRPHAVTMPVPRILPPGSDWLYAKLYTGTATADRVLRDELAPLVRELVARGTLRRWFFLRLGDPAWHLRVRFQGDHDVVRPRLEMLFQRLLESGAAWKFQFDTYERELERYGGDEGIELSEEVFFHDSDAVIDMLELFGSDAGADLRWRMALAGMDRLLDDFGYDLEAKLSLAGISRDNFAKRYRYEALRGPLADRFRQERPHLRRPLDTSALDRRSTALAPVVHELRRRERQGRLTAPITAIVPSYIHMYVNRLTRSAGPEHELVLYDFLVQMYRSQKARAPQGPVSVALR